MSFQASFKQILREKMTGNSHQNSSSGLLLDSDPAHLAFLMSQISKVQTSAPKGKYPAPAVRPQRKAHTLNAAQTQAFNFFSIYTHDFSPGFTEGELRKAFRKSALALHPDHGGNTQQFIELKEHYQTLQSVFTK
jgi:hypothetical protein